MRVRVSAFLMITLLMGSLLTPHALADMSAAQEAYNEGDKQLAFDLWKNAAEKGDSNAQFNVGNMLATGDGVSQSFQVANIYYRLAADQGHEEAQIFLATNYRLGQGTAIDIEQAMELLSTAAAAGHPIAQFDLAEIYLNDSLALPNSAAMAAGWYEGAAAQGVIIAQVKLANMYRKGYRVDGSVQIPKDEAFAFTWYEVAVRYARGDLVENSMSKSVFGLDDKLGDGQTLRETILAEYARLEKKLPKDLAADIKAGVQAQLDSVNTSAPATE